MNVIEAIILGVVQGLSEFLPVSSSGHLVLAEKLLGLPEENVRFAIMVHLGTLLAVIIAYRGQVRRLLGGLFRGRVRYRHGRWRFSNPDTRLVCLLALATIPAAVAGAAVGGWIKALFFHPLAVGICLAVTGLVLFGLRFVRGREGAPTFRRALIIGLAQAAAILPGISRSGLTISAGIYSGLERTRAADFSFLLAIPVILGAGLLEIGGMVTNGVTLSEVVSLLAGSAAAAVSGYLAIRFLLKIIQKGKLHYFAYYCWLAALVVIILSV
ncbi:MAG: undecaprenyl-diphosphate phosphatase [PVC group bacterium]